jgi:hypothetical protein
MASTVSSHSGETPVVDEKHVEHHHIQNVQTNLSSPAFRSDAQDGEDHEHEPNVSHYLILSRYKIRIIAIWAM